MRVFAQLRRVLIFFELWRVGICGFLFHDRGNKPTCYRIMRAGNTIAQSRNPHPHTPAARVRAPIRGPGKWLGFKVTS